jgi:secreted trypsin-like serine protease
MVLNIRDNGKICTQWFTVQPGASISYTQNRECTTGVSWEMQNNQGRLCCKGMPLTTPSTNFPRECGRQQYKPHKQRIVGGFHVNSNSWPWQVLLRGINNMCGGTLIDKQHVLTAAHCFTTPLRDQDYKVYIGAHDIEKPMYMEQEIVADKVFMHESYNSNLTVHDIAVIRLSRPVQISDTVNVICLPGLEVGKTVNETVWTTGWGRVVTNGNTSPILKQTWLHTMGDRCNIYGTNKFHEDRQICASRYTKDSSSCQGDSGGPLMVESPDGQWFINGVVSYGGMDCPALPTVYTRVKHYLPWIQSKIKP